MALPAVVEKEKFDSIPEGARQFYTLVEDTYIADFDVEAHPKVAGLRKAYKSDHEENKRLKDEVSKFKDIDPDKWSALKDVTADDLAELNELRTEKAKQNSNGHQPSKEVDIESEFAKRLAPVKSQHQRELDAKEQLLAASRRDTEKLRDDMRREKIRNELTTACAAEGVIHGAVEEVVDWASRYFKINDDGAIVAHDGTGMEVFGTTGAPMRAREWVATRGPDKAHWFPINTGGGAGGGRFTGTGGMVVTKKSDLKDVPSKVKFIKEYGLDAFDKLPAA